MLALTTATMIVVTTIALIVARPRYVGESGAAALGAAAMLLFGFARFADVWAIVTEVAGVLLFLLGMMALTAAVEASGLFDLLAVRTARAARGSGYALFAGIFGLGAVITMLLSLDVTVLILTPIVYALATRLRLNALPYMYACTFVANTGSLLLPISNLTNLLVYGLLGVGFARFAGTMLLPQIVALVVNLAVLFWIFREQLPRHFDRYALTALPANPDPAFLRIAATILGATLLALLASGLRNWPIYPPAVAGGSILLAAGVARRRIAPRQVAREISWGLFPFVVGMFTVIRAAETVWIPRLGVVGRLGAHDLPTVLLVAFGTAAGANLVNNVPMVAGMIGLLGHASPAAREPLALAALLGANLGPVITPFGSLATLIWLTIVRRKGEEVSTLGYMKQGVLIAPPVLLAATLALWIVMR